MIVMGVEGPPNDVVGCQREEGEKLGLVSVDSSAASLSSPTKPRQSSSQPPQPLSLDQQVLREVSSFKSPSTDPSVSLSHTLVSELHSNLLRPILDPSE